MSRARKYTAANREKLRVWERHSVIIFLSEVFGACWLKIET